MKTQKANRKSYKVKVGRNQWRVYHWDDKVECYRESHNILSYWQACEAVREANAAE